MKFKNEDEFLAYGFSSDDKVEVVGIKLQNRLRKANAKDKEIERLDKLVADLTLKNFLLKREVALKNDTSKNYSLNLSA